MKMESITITDERILAFFQTSMIDPVKFIQSAIENHGKVLEKPDPSLENTLLTASELNQFKKDYVEFLFKKKELIGFLKDQQKYIENLKLTHVEGFLEAKFQIKTGEFVCPHCTVKSYSSKKALAGHVKKCGKIGDVLEDSDDSVENKAL